jgi:hypothetical protein
MGGFAYTSGLAFTTAGLWRAVSGTPANGPVAHTGSTGETVLVTVPIPGGAMGTKGALRITTLWSAGANNANAKNGRVRFNNTSGDIILTCGLTSLLAGSVQRTVWNQGAENSQAFFVGATANSYTTSTTANSTSAIDTSADFSLVFTAALANGTDTLTLTSYLVELLYVP